MTARGERESRLRMAAIKKSRHHMRITKVGTPAV